MDELSQIHRILRMDKNQSYVEILEFSSKKGHARVKFLCFSMLHLATFGYKHLQYIFAHFMKHTKQKTTIKTTNKHPNKLIWVTKKAVKESNVIIMSQRKAYLEP